MQTRRQRQARATDDTDIDLRTTDDDDGERWLTVSEASELVGVSSDAIRVWYRSGRIPTQRTEGDHGSYLVPLSAILRLGVGAEEAGEAGDADDDDVIDLNASYWSIETSMARDETAAVREELDDARRQVAFLREQLAEISAGERAAVERAEAAEAELRRLREITAATSSIVDPSWLDLATNRYASPVRRQGAAPSAVAEAEPIAAALDADIDDEDDPVDEQPAKPLRPRPGQHADDLLPEAERRIRRGRR